MISIKSWETPLSWHTECSLPVAVRVSKMRVLKLPNVFTRAAEKEIQTRQRTLLCVQRMHMRGCHVFCASVHQRAPYGKTQDLYNDSEG